MRESFVWKETCVCSATPKQCKWNKCYSGIDVSLRQSCLHELCGGNGNYTEAGKRWEELVGSIFCGGRILDAICESICKLFGQFHRFPIGKRRIWFFFLLVHFVRSIKGRIDRRNSAKGPWNEKMDSLAKFFSSQQTNKRIGCRQQFVIAAAFRFPERCAHIWTRRKCLPNPIIWLIEQRQAKKKFWRDKFLKNIK